MTGRPRDRSESGSAKHASRRGWLALGLLSVTQFMLIADQTVVNIALPSIGADLRIAGAGLSWVINAYVLTFGGLLLLAGRATDVFGRRRMFIAGMLLFAGSSLAGGFAQSAAMVSARAVQGVGAATLSASALAALTGIFPEGPGRNRALGIWAGAAGSGGAVGVLLGGALTEGPGWSWVFWINVPIGLAAAALAPALFTEARVLHGPRLDVWGAVTGTAGVSLLVYAFVQTEQAGWGSLRTIGLLGAALGLLGVFVLVERRSAEPLLPFRIFSIGPLVLANAAMVAFAAGVFAMMFFLSLYLQNILRYSPLAAGLAFIPLAMGLVFGPVGGWLLTTVGARTTMIVGLVLASGGMAWFSRISVDGGFLTNVLGPSLLIAAGGQFAVVGMTTFALAGVADGDHGIASGVFNTSREIGGAFGIGVLAALAAARTNNQATSSSVHALNAGYQTGVLGAAAFVLAALALAVAVTLLQRRATATTTPAGAPTAVPASARDPDPA